MLTKETFIDYFDQILALEKEMEEQYLYVTANISHPEYRQIFRKLADEERTHQSMIQDLIELFQED